MPHYIMRRSWEIAVAPETFDTETSDLNQTSIDHIDQFTFTDFMVILAILVGVLSFLLIVIQIVVCCVCFRVLNLQRFVSRTELLLAIVRMICDYRQLVANMRAAMIPHLHDVIEHSDRGEPRDVGVSEVLVEMVELTGLTTTPP